MKEQPRIVYVAPNRSHHYRYAEGLERAGLLHCFVSGFPRFSRQAAVIDVPHEKIRRVDHWQLLYLAAARGKAPIGIVGWLNIRSKIALDRAFAQVMRGADIGLFYNGTGLGTLRRYRGKDKLFVCEAVNSHVRVQRQILDEEASRLGLRWRMPDAMAMPRREAEYQEADYILGPSDFVARSFVKMGHPPERCLKNPYGMPLPVSDTARPKPENDPLCILYVGQIHFRKGLRYLVEAFMRLPDRNCRLELVGPMASPTGLEGMVLPSNVALCGVLRGADLEAAYRRADIFVQPSLEEGLSLVIGEAMGHGLPVIASDCTGAEEILVSGESGWIVPALDVHALADAIGRLVDDRDLRQRLGAAARRSAEAFSGWEASGNRLAGLLEQIWAEGIDRSSSGEPSGT